MPGADPYTPVTLEHLLDTVNSQKAMVLYFSLAGGFLYSWLISPGTGIVKFHEVYLGETEDNHGNESPKEFSAFTLDQYISNAREALGVDGIYSRVCSNSETESEAGDLMEQQFDEVNNKLASADPTGYLRMVFRNHPFNRSWQSMASLNSATMSPGKEGLFSSPLRPSNIGKPPLRALYDLLISPMEVGLMHNSGPVGRHRQLVLVLEGDLYLIPFALLQGSSSNEYLYERFDLIAVPSLSSLEDSVKLLSRRGGTLLCSDGGSVAAVVGAPHVPPRVMDRWLWGPLPSAQEEAVWLGDQLSCHPLTGTEATKDHVLKALSQAECVHFATHISWKLAALVLAPYQEHVCTERVKKTITNPSLNGASTSSRQTGKVTQSQISSQCLKKTADTISDDEASICEDEGTCYSPPLQDFLLTAADILGLCLNVKLVVLRLYPESSGKVTADGVVGLTRAFLAAGVQCVCVSLWPVPIAASKLFMHTFYTSLMNGTKVSSALTEAMKVLQSSKHFSHPSNWAGYVLIGNDVKINSTMSLVGQALTEILQYPEKARDALRVILHLVEKSLQRIHSGQCNPMYTSQQSVENKVRGVPGWQALLSAVGFRLDFSGEGSSLPAAVFFPTSDPGDRLQQCSNTLQSLLGLTPTALQALCKLVTAREAGEQLVQKLHQVLVQLQLSDKDQDFSLGPIQVSISVQLWRLPGCHEFLAALGFDLCEVGQEEVVLKTGKQASRRCMYFALQSLLALFDSPELPKRLSMDSSSSLESLSSSQSTVQPHSLPASFGCYPAQSSFLAPMCPDNLSCDAISVYSLSSLASSLSFLSRPEPAGSDIISQRSNPVDHSKSAGLYSSPRHAALSRGRQTNHNGATLGEGEEDEYQGYSIISSEPLGRGGRDSRDCDTLPKASGQKRGSTGRGAASGSVSTPTSPVKAAALPIKVTTTSNLKQNNCSSPKNGKGKASSSESDQSSTETDSTVKSQEERMGPTGALDPQELAKKILAETQSHMQAVEILQTTHCKSIPLRVSQENKPLSLSIATPALNSKKQFQPSETSAFSRPPSRASTKTSSPHSPPEYPACFSSAALTSTPRPKLPPRSTSLQKVSSENASSTISRQKSSPSLNVHKPSLAQLQCPNSSRGSASSAFSHSCSNIASSPLNSSPSPTLSYSPSGSNMPPSSPSTSPEQKLCVQDTKSFHNLRNFWAHATQKQDVPCPASLLQGGNKKISMVQKDVLGLLNLSPKHKSSKPTEKAEIFDEQDHCRHNGHQSQGTEPPLASNLSTKSKDRHGFGFFSPGNFFPSSKC